MKCRRIGLLAFTLIVFYPYLLSAQDKDSDSKPQEPSISHENRVVAPANAKLAIALGADPPDLLAAKQALQAGADIDSTVEGRPWMIRLIRTGNLDGVKFCLNNSASLNSRTFTGRTPLHEAALYGLVDITALLIQRGADVNAPNPRGETPLFYATHPSLHIMPSTRLTKKHAEVATLLRAHGGVLTIRTLP